MIYLFRIQTESQNFLAQVESESLFEAIAKTLERTQNCMGRVIIESLTSYPEVDVTNNLIREMVMKYHLFLVPEKTDGTIIVEVQAESILKAYVSLARHFPESNPVLIATGFAPIAYTIPFDQFNLLDDGKIS